MSTLTPNPRNVQAALGRALHEHSGLFLAEGIILVLLGLIAIVVPPLASLAVTLVIGWLFVISGIAGLIMTFQARHAPGFWWALLSAVVAIVAGGLLLWQPLVGVLSLTFVLIAFFLVDGILSIFLAIEHRRELVGRWAWILVSGIVDLVIAAIIWAGLPGSAAWALGLLVGIDLVFGGTALIMVARAARRDAPAVA
ncbi:MAG: HdeD family acid-resistance protein [Hyphomicrobiales bacterium]|nr:HdeD family acid-resistance protein [Hyphomicrobiales bacterium]MBV8826014.1 HdeD family acid-resistance protein [Hyphomicrobiales bacterium]